MSTKLICILVSVLMAFMANCATVVNPTLIRQWTQPQTDISPLVQITNRDAQSLEQLRKPREYQIPKADKTLQHKRDMSPFEIQLQLFTKAFLSLRTETIRALRGLDGMLKNVQAVLRRELPKGRPQSDLIHSGHCSDYTVGGDSGLSSGQLLSRGSGINGGNDVSAKLKGRAASGSIYNENQQPGQTSSKPGLHLIYPAQFPQEIEAISVLSVQDRLSPSELVQFSTALITGRAQGLTNSEATLFAVRYVSTQIVLEVNGLQATTTLPMLAQAFKTAVAIASSRGMSLAEATNFASPMLRVQVLSGLQTSDVITQFADTYKRSLAIGNIEGMDIIQQTGFAYAVLPIQQFLGVQSHSTLVTFARSFMSTWGVGVQLGMGQDDVLRLASVMLQIQARVGTMSLDRLIVDAQLYLEGTAEAISQGNSATAARTIALAGIVVRSGVSLVQGPGPVHEAEGEVKAVEKGHGHGLIDVAGIDLLNNLGKGTLSNLQLLSRAKRDDSRQTVETSSSDSLQG